MKRGSSAPIHSTAHSAAAAAISPASALCRAVNRPGLVGACSARAVKNTGQMTVKYWSNAISPASALCRAVNRPGLVGACSARAVKYWSNDGRMQGPCTARAWWRWSLTSGQMLVFDQWSNACGQGQV